jgi:glutathione S-transferase
MRLIYSIAACSISTHIVLEEIGLPFSTERVSTKEGGTQTEQFLALNPKGKVPVLVLDDGEIVTETPVILQFLARSFPEQNLLPTDLRRQFEILQICEYLGNTVHTFGLTRIFQPKLFCAHEDGWAEVREQGVQVMRKAFDLLARRLDGRSLLFDEFSIADASLFFHELHASRLRIPMPDAVRAHFDLMLTRTSVQSALAREEIDLAAYIPDRIA